MCVLFLGQVLTCSPASLAGEVRPYPYEAPAWKVELRKKLEVRYDFESKDLPLRDAAEKLSGITGVHISFAVGTQEAARRRISSQPFRNSSAESILDFLAANADLRYRLTEKGVLFTHDRSPDPTVLAERIGREIEGQRRLAFPTRAEKAEQEKQAALAKTGEKERKERIEKQKTAIRTTKVNKDFVDESVEKILTSLGKESKVPFLLSTAAQERVRSEKVSIKGGSGSVEKVRDELLKAYGLVYHFMEGVVLIALPSEPVKADDMNEASFVFKEEQERRERKILGLKLAAELRGPRVCDFVEGLAKDLRLKVYPDSRAWGTEVKLPSKTTGLTLRQLAAILKRTGVEVVVHADLEFYRPQRWRIDEPPPKAPPPGGPELDWAVYLFKKKS